MPGGSNGRFCTVAEGVLIADPARVCVTRAWSYRFLSIGDREENGIACAEIPARYSHSGNDMSQLVRIVIQLPVELKQRLDALRHQGYTTSGFIRAMLERELAQLPDSQPSALQDQPPKKHAA